MANAAAGSKRSWNESRTGAFFMATLFMWSISVIFEILFNNRPELSTIFIGFLFFQSANLFIRKCSSSRDPDPLFVNTCVSLLHASITSAAVVSIVVKEWRRSGVHRMFEHSELVETTWSCAYEALCISCGYFAYDQSDMLLNGVYNTPSILLHHLVLLVCFTLALYRKLTINYLILTLICELHSISLHVRKLRRMSRIRDQNRTAVKVEWMLNFATFLSARFASHVLITIKLLRDATKFQQGGVELPLALTGMAAMNLLNVFLGMDLLSAYTRETRRRIAGS